MMSARSHPPRGGGFALIEVIIALGIFTVVVFAVVLALDSALDAAKERNEVEAATFGLANQLALIHGQPLYPVDHDLPDDGSGLLYHVTVASEQVQNMKKQAVVNLYRVTVTAKWISNAELEDRSVSELVYQP